MFDILNPYRWLAGILSAAAVVGLLTWGVHTYNVKVSAKAVEAALEKERAVTAPIIKELAERVAARDSELATIKTKSDAERLRRTAVVELKTKELKDALAQNQILADKNTKLLGDSDGVDRLLKSIEARNNNRTDTTGGSAEYKRQSTALIACERDLGELAAATAETSRRLGDADVIIKALKN